MIYSFPNFQTRFSQNHVFQIGTQNFSKTNKPIALNFVVVILYIIV